MRALDTLFSTPEMAAAVGPEANLRQLLRFEAALARIQARVGLVPPEAAEAIAAACQAEQFDLPTLYAEAASAGTVAIPVVRLLRAAVGSEHGRFVHWGATSQDAVDSAMMLQLRDGLDLLIAQLLDISGSCALLAERHRGTLLAGRTLLQQALPITFGLKAARWLALTVRQTRALRRVRHESLAVQFGGAAGTLAVLGNSGLLVAEELAAELALPLPELPWHAERDRVAALAAALGVVAGAMAKIACDLVLLAQSEVAEVSEATAPGKGGSSALPQKRNPVDATMALAAARLAQGLVPVIMAAPHEHERAAGGWQAEWAALPDLCCYTAGAAERVRSALAGLQVDEARMRANLEHSGGLLMAESVTAALAPALGYEQARHLVEQACSRALASGTTLRQALLADGAVSAALDSAALDAALDPASYLGSTGALIDQALRLYREAIAPG